MIAFVLLFAIVCLYNVQIKLKTQEFFFEDYMSIEKTTSIKGIFIIIVFFSHFIGYISINNSLDEYAIKPIVLLGQCMVTMFLFYSGYGIMESVKKKDLLYIRTMPKNRLFGTIYRFDIAVLIFFIIGLLMGKKYSFIQVLLSFIGWESVGNSNWYIFVVLLLYLFSYISFTLFRNNHRLALTSITALTIIYIFVLWYFNLKETYWYDTAICYPLGIAYSLNKSKIETIIKNKKKSYVFCLLTITILFIVLKCLPSNGLNIIFYFLRMPVFVALIVLITMKVSFNNKVLNWFGTHLFEIYILQRIPMIVFKHIGLDENIYVYFVLCMIVTLLLAWGYKIVIDKTWMGIVKRLK